MRALLTMNLQPHQALKMMMKPVLSALVILVSLSVNAQLWNFRVNPAQTTVAAGASFNVTIHLEAVNGSSQTTGAIADVNFDPAVLEVTAISVAPGNLLNVPIVSPTTSLADLATINADGHFHYGSFAFSTITTSFDFVNVTFMVKPGAPAGTTNIEFATGTLGHETEVSFEGNSILNAVFNGEVTIEAACPPPTATLTASATCGGSNFNLILGAATGTGPFDLTIDGTVYNNITVGSTITSISIPELNIYQPADIPGIIDTEDGDAVTVGNKFSSSVGGYLKGIRFYKGNTGTGTYTGLLYDFNTSTLLGSGTFVTSPGAGWQEVIFATPVYLTAGQVYVAAVHNTDGYYSFEDAGLNTPITSGPLTVPAGNGGGDETSNGLYVYSTNPTFPDNSWNNSNYMIDVVFSPSQFTIELQSVVGDDGCTATGSLQSLVVTSVPCALPVTMLNLSASASGSNNIIVKWATASEQNNKGFEIRRSLTGTGNWETIGFVAGVGESNSVKNYSYLDQNLPARRYFYQLNQIDFDGRSKLSTVVSANLGTKEAFGLEQNFPNPFKGNETNIRFTIPHRSQVQLIVYDMNGRVIKTLVNGVKDAGTHSITFQDNSLPTGIYFYKLTADGYSDVKKMTIR